MSINFIMIQGMWPLCFDISFQPKQKEGLSSLMSLAHPQYTPTPPKFQPHEIQKQSSCLILLYLSQSLLVPTAPSLSLLPRCIYSSKTILPGTVLAPDSFSILPHRELWVFFSQKRSPACHNTYEWSHPRTSGCIQPVFRGGRLAVSPPALLWAEGWYTPAMPCSFFIPWPHFGNGPLFNRLQIILLGGVPTISCWYLDWFSH